MGSVWRLMCPQHHKELVAEKNIPISSEGIVTKCPLFFCDVCECYYFHTDISFQTNTFEYGKYTVKNTENIPYIFKEKRKKDKYTFTEIAPMTDRRATEEVLPYLNKYEDCRDKYVVDFPYSLLHYAFIFRRFDEVKIIFEALDADEINSALHFKGERGHEWVTPLICAKWNLNYIYAYDEKNNTTIIDVLEEFLPEVEHIDEIAEYTDIVDKEGNTVFDLFWKNSQPLLDVVYFDRQELASKQVDKNKFCIVMDEVGTGKTVSALYAIRNIMAMRHARNETAKILVVCPYNKREDWQNDIRRQMGRYAHIIEQGDNGFMYEGGLKKVFFKRAEDVIMIAGSRQGSDLEGSYTALKGTVLRYSENEDWDLAIIDEGHISFVNYSGISAKKAMILTATPIVVNAKERRTYEAYVRLLQEITDSKTETKAIDPIKHSLPDESDIYVNWFREDMGKNAAERKIRFVSCKRHPDRDKLYYRIRDEAGILAALAYDQDDNYLFDAARERYDFPDVKEIRKNGKVEKLVEVLHENEKSFIIFCEHQYVVDLIFKRLKDEFSDTIVAEKYGSFENQYGLGNVQEGQLINTLMQALRNGQRVLFVTTGKTGGMGLNLGEFGGVIHYELPFTSIELEQRFGRVDRIDTIISSENRDMIFMLNECKADENDMEVNRMLYYCTTKIDITCQYMPIRNTVLYYPEFVRRNGRAIRESLVYFQNEYVLSESNEGRIKEIRRQRRQYEGTIKKSEYWNEIQMTGKTVRECVINVLHIEKKDSIGDEQYHYMGEYIEFLRKTKAERNEYERVYRKFLESKRNVNNWLAIIGLTEVDENSEIFVGYRASEDGDESSIELEKKDLDQDSMKKITSVQKQIKELIQLIDKSDFEHAELNGFSSEGIFCYKDNMIKRTRVDDYRNGNGWR